MKLRKNLERWTFNLDAVEEDRVFLRIYSLDKEGDALGDELELPIKSYIRMFGEQHLELGSLGQLYLYINAKGERKLRGWPYKRKWTKEDINQAEELAKAWSQAFSNG